MSEGSEGLPEGLESLSQGSEGLPEEPEGLPGGQGGTDERTDRRTNGISPHSIGLHPPLGAAALLLFGISPHQRSRARVPPTS